MKNDKPLILISNDDGVNAKGINELIRFIRPLGEIVVMAPDNERSGSSCSLTSSSPIYYKLIKKEPGLTVYSCSGTPVDNIKLARNVVLDREPDLIVGGINHGDNSGPNVHYGGTMGVAIEGCLNGVSSIAFSIDSHDKDVDFEPCQSYIKEIVSVVLKRKLPPFICLNVNFPAISHIEGLKVCVQAVGHWYNEWEPCSADGDKECFKLSGEFVNHEPENELTDNWAVAHGYAAVTPITVNATGYTFIEELNQRLSLTE